MTLPLFDELHDYLGPLQSPLLDDVRPMADLSGMVRAGGHHTSVDAAAAIEPKRTALHVRVLEAFEQLGPMTDEALERLPQFADYGPSTIRKRRSELYEQGALAVRGDTVNSRGRKMILWVRTELP
jgi:hypothetical protein